MASRSSAVAEMDKTRAIDAKVSIAEARRSMISRAVIDRAVDSSIVD
jgi:hypothetical protein